MTTAQVSPGGELIPPATVGAGGSAGSGLPGAPGWPQRAFRWLGEGNLALVTFLAIVVGLFVGAILIVVTTPATLHAWGHVGSAPGHAFGVTFSTLGNAYGALFTG